MNLKRFSMCAENTKKCFTIVGVKQSTEQMDQKKQLKQMSLCPFSRKIPASAWRMFFLRSTVYTLDSLKIDTDCLDNLSSVHLRWFIIVVSMMRYKAVLQC